MKIKFNEDARAALQAMIDTDKKKAVRLKVLAFGWGKPALGFVLEEQKENDVAKVVKDIKFIVEPKYEMYFESTEILYNPKAFTGGFYVHSVSD